MLSALDIMTGKILVQLQLAPPDEVRNVLRQLDQGSGDGTRDLINRLTDMGRLTPKEIELVRNRAALYEHVRAEASYLRLLEKHAQIPKTTVAKLIAELERHAFRRRLGDVLVKGKNITQDQDRALSQKTQQQMQKDDQGIIDRYRREDFAGVAKPLMPGRRLVPEDFKISTLFRSKETRALVDKAELEALLKEAQNPNPEPVDQANMKTQVAEPGQFPDEIPDATPVKAPEPAPAAKRVESRGGEKKREKTGPAGSPPIGMDMVRKLKRISDYVIVELLGAGGMGAVFLGQKDGGFEFVAIKVMLNQAANEQERGRFNREISLTKRVKHRNVIGILDSGKTAEGLSYLVVPALAGKELRSILDKNPEGLEPVVACAIMEQVLEGMQAVHDAHIVHRDMKPENVFILSGGTDAKIMDFGLAKLDEETEKDASSAIFRSMSGEVVGSPPYIAPESITSDPIDRRTDIYSVGVMFFEMLTGKRPIESETAQGYLTAHLIAPPMTLKEARPERAWPPEAEKLIEQMLGKTRDERQESCQVILEQLRGGVKEKLLNSGVPIPPTLTGEVTVSAVAPTREDSKRMGVKGLLGRLLGNND